MRFVVAVADPMFCRRVASEVEFMCCSLNLTRISSTECPADVPKGARTKEAKPMSAGKGSSMCFLSLQPR